MSTFLQVCGVIFLLSLFLGGAWIGACQWADFRLERAHGRRMFRIAELCEQEIRRDALRRIHQNDAIASRRLQEREAKAR